MADWIATTSRGTTWRYRGGILRIEKVGNPWPEVFMPWGMAVLEDSDAHLEISEDGEKFRINWDYIRDVREAQVRELAERDADFVPVIGSLIYAGSKDQWRISSPVVQIEMI